MPRPPNKEIAACAVTLAEATVAAAEKVAAEVAWGVSLAAELAALKALERQGEANVVSCGVSG